VILAILVVTAVVQVLRARPPAVTGVMPGSFTGYAFDTCEAPTQEQMDAWLLSSPYWGVGIYISGENRACADQPNLDRTWVAAQASRGWRLLPLSVGRQAPCSEGGRWSKIDPSPAKRFAAARDQGDEEAANASAAARDLGIAPGSTLWLDVEAFDVSRTRCRDATLAYVSSWTRGLSDRGYRSGFYSSAASGVRMLEQARLDSPGRWALPRHIWVGAWNQRHDTESAYKARDGWTPSVVHQYSGPHAETYGGVTLDVDSNFMEVGRGTVAAPRRVSCPTPRSYQTIREGDRSASVAALRCLLGDRDPGGASASAAAYTAATTRAVAALQRSRGLPATGVTDRRTWVVLLSRGPGPLLKFGSGGDAVRRVQAALGAWQRSRIPVTGVFGERTRAVVQRYQRRHGLPPTGVVDARLWRLVQSGR
jgi:peptidoglycan hydrolase-like protein with peptidoglycan-binding domain